MGERYAGSRAWITGGGSGIGRALALELARQGARVAVSGRRADRLEQTAGEVSALGAEGLALACDVTEEAEVARSADAAADALGGLDLVVANAGFAVGGPVETLDAAAWRRQLDVNVVGAALTARHALPHLRASRGRLGLVGSVAAFVGMPGAAAYCASKAALRALGQSLSAELAGTGVSCTTVHPGYVESEIGQVDNEGVFDPERPDRRPKNLMWTAEDAAKVMLRAIHRRSREHVFTTHGKAIAFAGQHFPGLMLGMVGRQTARRRSRRRR
ncbi:MAG: SDR family NAD(P)-dependent oxidoreductase [Sandaracinaceae bacterium]